MAVRKVLTRLLRLREMEEELGRLALESAVEARAHVELEFTQAAEARAEGNKDFAAGVDADDRALRTGGGMEIQRSLTRRSEIEPRLATADAEVARQTEEFLAKRIRRRQVETLADGEREAARSEAARRAQQMLDDWYGRRTPRRAEEWSPKGQRTARLEERRRPQSSKEEVGIVGESATATGVPSVNAP